MWLCGYYSEGSQFPRVWRFTCRIYIFYSLWFMETFVTFNLSSPIIEELQSYVGLERRLIFGWPTAGKKEFVLQNKMNGELRIRGI